MSVMLPGRAHGGARGNSVPEVVRMSHARHIDCCGLERAGRIAETGRLCVMGVGIFVYEPLDE